MIKGKNIRQEIFLFIGICLLLMFFGCAAMAKSSGEEANPEPPPESAKTDDTSISKPAAITLSEKEEVESPSTLYDIRESGTTPEDKPDSMEDFAEDGVSTSTSSSEGTPSSSGLKAGFADDNKQFNYFVNFLKEFQYVTHFPLNIEERIVFNIKDTSGNSIPNAEIAIYGNGKNLLCRGKSHADGTFLFFPSEYGPGSSFIAKISFLQEEQELRISRYEKRKIDVIFNSNRPGYQNIPLDILFIMDTTGSMGEEINRLKTTIEIINLNLVNLSSKPDVRFGMVTYKDRGEDEEYITQIIPLTKDIDHFQVELDQVYADGGGDYPEDLQSALEDTLKKIDWSPNGIRLSFIITDAPPHLDYKDQVYTYVDASRDAREKGIKIYSVGTGGLDIYGEYILRQISQYTYAKYIFLTYGEKGESSGSAPGSVSHHTGSNWQADKLESIIIRFAKEELSYLTDQPLDEGEEFFNAVRVEDENREETLQKLFDMALVQLIDYSSIRIPKGTAAAIMPVISADEAYLLDAEYFTDQLIESLSMSNVFKMVERKDIQKILEEQELQLSGLVDDRSVVKVGSFLGAEMLISGKLYIKENRFELFLKLLRVETAEVLGVTRAKIDRNLGLSE